MDGYDAKNIGRRVRAYRRAAGMTAEELARAVGEGMTRAAITKLENGYRVDISTEMLVELAWALRVPPLVLLFPLENPSAQIEIGREALDMNALGAWLTGVLPGISDERVTPATRVGNAVHTQFRQLIANEDATFANFFTYIVENVGKDADAKRAAVLMATQQSADAARAGFESLAMLRESLGLDDG